MVKWSAGSAVPALLVPAGSADCHHHIYDHRFPTDPRASSHQGDASVDDYRGLQRRLGTTRNVIVQPSTYGTDNSLLLEALATMGPSSRGVAVVDDGVAESELARLHLAGVRGIRFNLVQTGATTPSMLARLAPLMQGLGWHIQFNMSAAQIVELAEPLIALPCPVVFDHLAHLPPPDGLAHPAFTVVRRVLDTGRGWVKLSGAYIDSRTGPPGYADIGEVARAFVQAAPGRMVWGSDWPHPTAQPDKPDDAVLLDLLAEWAPDEALRHRILVDNPAELYGF
jgi:predicted TIM-barrel fold metal-dependent hydrolase